MDHPQHQKTWPLSDTMQRHVSDDSMKKVHNNRSFVAHQRRLRAPDGPKEEKYNIGPTGSWKKLTYEVASLS